MEKNTLTEELLNWPESIMFPLTSEGYFYPWRYCKNSGLQDLSAHLKESIFRFSR